MLKQYLLDSQVALDEMRRSLDEQREQALAEALSGVPKIVLAAFNGQFNKTVIEHESGHRIEYRMGVTLLVEEIRIHDEYVFHIHPQK